jgi:hypothetical protein
MPRWSACCSLLAAAAVQAQSAPCAGINHTSASVGTSLTANSPTAPNTFAYRVTLGLPSGTALRAMTIFTGNTVVQPGFMMLEIWHETGGLPSSRWSGGTWQISHALGTDWQGANTDLDLAGVTQPVWVVWTEPGSSTEPYEPGGVTVPTAQLINGVWTLLPAQTAPKLRFHCQRLDGAHVTVPYFSTGGGCWAWSGIGWGTLFTNQQPAVGNADFALEGTSFLSGQLAWLVLGTTPGGGAFQCTLQNDRTVALWGFIGTGDVRASAATTGAARHVTFPLPIPTNSQLAGMFITGQLVVFDPASTPLPFTVSNILHIVLF